MAMGEEPEISEAQIAVHWREEEYIQPPPRFVARPTRTTRRSWSASAKRTSRSASGSTPTS